VISGILMV